MFLLTKPLQVNHIVKDNNRTMRRVKSGIRMFRKTIANEQKKRKQKSRINIEDKRLNKRGFFLFLLMKYIPILLSQTAYNGIINPKIQKVFLGLRFIIYLVSLLIIGYVYFFHRLSSLDIKFFFIIIF